MRLTRDQRRAAETEGRDLVVLAGAGSGKTAVLIERVLHLVTRPEDPHDLSRILAITFTKKAAREMKTRLARAFEEASLPRMREQVEWAHVSTIHSFCARVLRENAVEAGVDPSFTVLEQAAAEALLREVLGEISDRWSAFEEGRARDLMRVCGDFEDTVLGVYGRLRGAGNTPEELRIEEASPTDFDGPLETIVDAMDLLPGLLDSATAAARVRAERVLEHRPRVGELIGASPGPEEVRVALQALGASINLGAGKETKEILRRLRTELIPAATAEVADAIARPGLAALRGFLTDLDREYRERKVGLGLLDFNDLEVMTLRMLMEDGGVRDALAARYTQVLVDEYQDVNPVQAEILRRIRSPGNHFAVGDVKQSIYGFRYSDPRIFADLSEQVGEEGRVVLRTNFRSGPALVEFANHCFGELFADQPLIDWSDIEMPSDYVGEEGRVEILLVEEGKAAEVRAEESRAIAGLIRDAVRAGEFAFRDVAILFRALTDVKVYERALESIEIPYYVVKGRGFYEAREVVDLVRMLECVRNPRDQLSMAAALRSPFAGLSEDALLTLVDGTRGDDMVLADLLDDPDAVVGLDPADAQKWSRFAALLKDLRNLASHVTLRELIETALTRSGYWTALWLMPFARRRDANLRKVIELADALDDLFDLEQFLVHLRESRLREVQETEAPTGGEEEDVVRILTVHGAKGLEFPVVILPDLSRAARWTAPDLLLDDGEVAARIVTGPDRDKLAMARWEELREERMLREKAEHLRLLYVAVTRAERRLVLCADRGKARAGTWWSLLSSVLPSDEMEVPYGGSGRTARIRAPGEAMGKPRARVSVVQRHESRIARGRPIDDSAEEESAWAGDMLDRTRRVPEPQDHSRFQNTVSELLLFSHCEYCYRRRHVLGIPHVEESAAGAPDRTPSAGGSDELPPSERGLLVHEILRTFDPHGEVPLAEAVRAGTAAADPRLGEDLEGMIAAFYASDIGREVMACPAAEVRREVPFLTRWRIPEGPDLLIRGQIDLLYRRPNGSLRVIDYKTGGGGYDLQLAVYAIALERFQSRPVEDAYVVYLRPDGTTRERAVPLTRETSVEVEEVAVRFARTLAAGGPVARAHSKGCRYR